MDINDLRSLFTVLALAAFLGIVWWAYSGKRKASFDEAANLAVEEDEPATPEQGAGRKTN